MMELVPLSAVPPELVAVLLEQGGPTVAVVAALWYRMNVLENRLSRRVDRLEDDVDSNAAAIYDNVLPHHDERPGSELDRGEPASD